MNCVMVSRPKALFLNDTRVEQHFGCKMVVENLSAAISDAGFEVSKYVTQAELMAAKSCSSLIEGVDLVVVNGEGTLHGDRSINYKIISVAELAQRKGVPVVLLNATLECNSVAFYERFSCFSEIVLRESQSLKELRRVNCSQRIIPDATFFVPDDLLRGCSSISSIEPSNVFVDDSVLPNVSLDLAVLRKKLNAKSSTLFYSESKFRWALGFLRRAPRYLVKSPVLAIKYLALMPCQISGAQRDFMGFLSYMRGAELAITGRFHMVCMLLVLERPFLAVESNTKKISSLLADVGISNRVFSTVSDLERYYFSKSCHDYTDEEKDSIARFKRMALVGRAELVGLLRSFASLEK